MAGKINDKHTIQWLFHHSREQHVRMLILVAGNIIFATTSAVFALMCRGIVDSAVSGKPGEIARYGLGLFAIITLQLVLRLYLNALEELILARLEISFRRNMLDFLLKKDYRRLSGYHSGELLNRMFSDVGVICQGLTSIVPSFLNMATRIVCAVLVLIMLDRKLTLIFLGAGICLFIVTRFFRKKLKYLHRQVQEKEGKVRSFLQETMESLLIVKVFGIEQKMEGQNEINQQEHYKARMKRRAVGIMANAGFSFVFQMGYLFALLWGAFRIFSGAMTYGTLTAILQLVNQIQTPFANLSSLFPKYYGMLASAERIMELEELPDEEQSERRLEYPDFRRLTLTHAGFSYGENRVLSDVNITIEKGEFVSLTGISGGGKTTLFLLLLGAYRPLEGSVCLEGEQGDYLPGIETRSLFAYVPQGNFLFSGTVAENIAFLKPEATEAEIWTAAKTACADDFIQALPNGLDTVVGEKGFGISEGQAQRIAIARAVLSGASILLLDEATSALDERTEERLLQNIARLSDKTLLVVTHRPAALAICSKHLILKDGNITLKRRKTDA